MLTVCDSIKQALDADFLHNGPEELQNYYQRSGLEKEQLVLKALKWPMQILELLICNNEQAVLALGEARVVEALG